MGVAVWFWGLIRQMRRTTNLAPPASYRRYGRVTGVSSLRCGLT